MYRFFLRPENIKDGHVLFGEDDARHILRVLRLGVGDRLIAINPAGFEYIVEISLVSRGRVLAKIVSERAVNTEPPIEVTIIQGLPKGDKMAAIIQKSTELGAIRFVPVATERSVVRLAGERAESRAERWQRIAQEAAEQSRRVFTPVVEPVRTWAEACEEAARADLAVVAWEEEGQVGLKNVLRTRRQARKIAVFVGPEGGLTADEVELAREKGAWPVTLGPRILRTETAAPAMVAMILYELGDLGGF